MIKNIFKNEIKSVLFFLRPKIIKIIPRLIRPFSQSSNQWLNRQNKDQFVKKAKIVYFL